ncbi:hypothetical protein BKA70DRAFT_1418815 [Coprinopsis sp. MPI-PUGE-AT-0042]|nr:hypothetical protein BKA70DRAFT_1418815 [Coprinopsis sp. MPI-PUGE-AT-0042]
MSVVVTSSNDDFKVAYDSIAAAYQQFEGIKALSKARQEDAETITHRTHNQLQTLSRHRSTSSSSNAGQSQDAGHEALRNAQEKLVRAMRTARSLEARLALQRSRIRSLEARISKIPTADLLSLVCVAASDSQSSPETTAGCDGMGSKRHVEEGAEQSHPKRRRSE